MFDFDDLTEKGIISIKTNGFDRTTTEKRTFRFEGRDIAAYFSVGWTCSMKISSPPITLNSSMIFEFDETDDYWFFYRLWHAAEDFLKYLTFGKNTLIEDCSLQVMYDDSHYLNAAEFKLVRSAEPFDAKPLEKGRYIQLPLLDPYEIKDRVPKVSVSVTSSDCLFARFRTANIAGQYRRYRESAPPVSIGTVSRICRAC